MGAVGSRAMLSTALRPGVVVRQEGRLEECRLEAGGDVFVAGCVEMDDVTVVFDTERARGAISRLPGHQAHIRRRRRHSCLVLAGGRGLVGPVFKSGVEPGGVAIGPRHADAQPWADHDEGSASRHTPRVGLAHDS